MWFGKIGFFVHNAGLWGAAATGILFTGILVLAGFIIWGWLAG